MWLVFVEEVDADIDIIKRFFSIFIHSLGTSVFKENR